MTGSTPPPLLSVVDLSHGFPSSSGSGHRPRTTSQVLTGIRFDLEEGSCLGVVGESGAGKTTLARCLLRLMEPSGGEIRFRGRNVLAMSRAELAAYRKRVQIVFQDPFGSLNPRLRAGGMIEEVLKVHSGGIPAPQRRERVHEILGLVGLLPGVADRFPHEMSGGQRQRLSIARALSVEPELLVLDEPVSALDLSLRAQVLELLKDLQARLGLSLLIIAHDLAVVRQLADEVVVLYGGRIMEAGPAPALLDGPLHPYSKGLLAASDPAGSGGGSEDPWSPLPGDSPDPTRPLGGCVYEPRCPHPGKTDECRTSSPDLRVPCGSRTVACWKATGRENGG